MEIIKHEHQRLSLRSPFHPPYEAIEEVKTRVLRFQFGRRRKVRQAVPHLGDNLRDRRRLGPNISNKSLLIALREVGADNLHPRPEGRCAIPFPATSPEDE
jgi:hypothetical protein